MDGGDHSTSSTIATDMVLSVATGILYGLGVAFVIVSIALLLLDIDAFSSMTNMLFGGERTLSDSATEALQATPGSHS